MSEKACKILDCGRPYGKWGTKGYCNAHYQRFRSGRPLDGPIRIRDGRQGCKVTGCAKKHDSLGYCDLHHKRFRFGRTLNGPIQIQDGEQGCVIMGCKKKHRSLGYCATHYLVAQHREKKIQLVVEFGEHCADCHRKYPPCVFDFDNIGDSEEHTNLGRLLSSSRPWERIAKEVGKCDMVCSNCHRIRTKKRIGY